jgi:hypothetical protein
MPKADKAGKIRGVRIIPQKSLRRLMIKVF